MPVTVLLGKNEKDGNSKARITSNGALKIADHNTFSLLADRAVIASDFTTEVTDTESRQYLLEPSTAYHTHINQLDVMVGAGAEIRIYEVPDTDVTTHGTVCTHMRLNRQSTIGDTVRVFLYHTPTLADTGTLKFIGHNGGTTSVGPRDISVGGISGTGSRLFLNKAGEVSYLLDIKPDETARVGILLEYQEAGAN